MSTPPPMSAASAKQPADDVDVPAEQVDPREREVLGADHDRQQEVAERRRDRRDQEEEHHDDAVHREHPVVDVRGHQVAGRRQQLEPDQQREEAAEEEEDRDREQVQQPDPLVVGREQPGSASHPIRSGSGAPASPHASLGCGRGGFGSHLSSPLGLGFWLRAGVCGFICGLARLRRGLGRLPTPGALLPAGSALMYSVSESSCSSLT